MEICGKKTRILQRCARSLPLFCAALVAQACRVPEALCGRSDPHLHPPECRSFSLLNLNGRKNQEDYL
eukprot:2022966-Amphidinium_carterae.1